MRRTRLVLLALAAWTFVALYFATQAYFNPAFRMRPRWSEAVVVNLTYYYLWGAITPLVIWLARRKSHLLVHAAASVILTAVHMLVAETILWTFTRSVYRNGPFLETLKTAFGVNFHSSLPTYWLILAVYLAWTYSRNASRLEAQLSRAQLDALKMQLNPHFLFNTLNSVSSLMYTDVAAADAMLARLSEFLRLTLERPIEQVIPLSEELDFAKRYLEIERIRFEDRLRVTIDVEPGLDRMGVPALVLQPLVENAIHHGIAHRSEGGAITIRANRDGELLRVVVHDDGGARGTLRERVGLKNTRARVEALRGTMHYTSGNGFRVEIAIPCFAL